MGILKWLLAIALIVIGIHYFGSDLLEKFKSIQSDTESDITIGFIGPLTGDAVSYGEPISNAVRLAVDEINADGGVEGRRIRVIYEDGKCAAKNAINAAQKLVNVDKVPVIIGGVCSSEALAAVPITEKKKVIVLSPSASSPELTGAGRFFFRNNPSDSSGGKFLADMIPSERSVAIISEKTDYAQALREVFVKRFKEQGGEIVSDESFAPETGDFRSILTKIKAKEPDALIINPQTEIAGGTIGKQVKELGIEAKLYGSNIMSGSKTLEIAGENIEGLLLFDNPGISRDNAKAAKFLKNYKQKYGDLSIEFYLGAAYDAVYILAEAIGMVGDDTEKIRKYLHTMRKFEGVVGTYEFDENGDLSGIEHVAKKIEGGAVVTVGEDAE